MLRNGSIGHSNGPGLEASLVPEDRPQYRIAHLNGYPVLLIPVIIPFVYIGCSGEPPGKSKLQEPLIKSLLPRLNANAAALPRGYPEIDRQVLFIS